MRPSGYLLALLVPASVLAAPIARAAEHEQVPLGLPDQHESPAAPGSGAANNSGTVLAQAPAPAVVTPAPVPQYQVSSGVGEYFANWFNRVHAAQESQPHWMTPVVTVTPRLEEEIRYDQFWQHQGTGGNINVFDGGKGLELIPTTTNELLFNLPPYQERISGKPATGWADWPFFTIKQRLLSANEQNGNYIVTAFLGLQAPTGIKAFTNDAWIITPTLAGGKGWGDFDIQMTVGVPIPTDHESTIGTALVWNTAFQYHFAEIFWPEFEVNFTHWFDGQRSGKTQVFLTPGFIFGRFPLFNNAVRAIVGGGYQFAVTPKLTTSPVLTPMYNHAWILTTRLAF